MLLFMYVYYRQSNYFWKNMLKPASVFGETVAPEEDSSRDDIGCTATLEVSHEPVETPAIPVDVLSDITNARPQKKVYHTC